jgi:hypothetical protein
MSQSTHGKNHNLAKNTIFKHCDFWHVVNINSILAHGKYHKLSKTQLLLISALNEYEKCI